MSDFLKGLLSTAISIIVLSLINIILLVPAIVAAIVAVIVYGARDRRSLANGILAGIGIGLVFLGATCFTAFTGF